MEPVQMKDPIKVFFALAAIIGGATCIICFLVTLISAFGWASDFFYLPILGTILIAAGTTYFWMRTKFSKR
jgi:hypothetical protein